MISTLPAPRVATAILPASDPASTSIPPPNPSTSIPKPPEEASVAVAPILYRKITLTVHSSLEAVGFMAAIAKALAGERVPCNAVAGYYHDHIYVPEGKVESAMSVFAALGRGD